jgi:hypothetical protein
MMSSISMAQKLRIEVWISAPTVTMTLSLLPSSMSSMQQWHNQRVEQLREVIMHFYVASLA